jgi:hypothetical protein
MQERQRTVAERIEVVAEMRPRGWSLAEAVRNLQIPRTTLMGYLNAEETLRSTDVDPFARRAAPPGPQARSHEFEPALVALITGRANEGRRMTRGDVIAECSQRIPDFAEKSPLAQSSWLTRFLKRHRLANSIALYPKKNKGTRCPCHPRGAVDCRPTHQRGAANHARVAADSRPSHLRVTGCWE